MMGMFPSPAVEPICNPFMNQIAVLPPVSRHRMSLRQSRLKSCVVVAGATKTHVAPTSELSKGPAHDGHVCRRRTARRSSLARLLDGALSRSKTDVERDRLEKALEECLRETFPTSDAVACSSARTTRTAQGLYLTVQGLKAPGARAGN